MRDVPPEIRQAQYELLEILRFDSCLPRLLGRSSFTEGPVGRNYKASGAALVKVVFAEVSVAAKDLSFSQGFRMLSSVFVFCGEGNEEDSPFGSFGVFFPLK